MLPGALTVPPVATWQHRVTVDGQVMDHVSWSVDRSLKNVPGASQADSITVGTLTPVAPVQGTSTPWNRAGNWPPRKGTPVTVEVSVDGVTYWPVLTGVSDTPAGDIPGDLSVDVVDRVDRFTRTLSRPPLAALMPPLLEGGGNRNIGLHHFTFIDAAFQAAGYYQVPQGLPGSRLYCSMQGTMWPQVGVCTGASKRPIGIEVGLGQWNASATYTFDAIGSFDFKAYLPTTQSDSSGSVTGSSFVKYAFVGTGLDLIFHPASRTVELVSGTTSLASRAGVGNVIVVRRNGSAWQLSDKSGNATYSGASGALTGLNVQSSGNARFSMVNVAAYGSTAPAVADWSPTAIVGFASHMTEANGTPTIATESAKDVLDTIAAATWSHWGFDEQGRAVWIPTLGVIGLAPVVSTPAPIVRTIVDDTDMTGTGKWSQDWQASASQVVCNLKAVDAWVTGSPRVDLWKDSSQTLAPGDPVVSVFAEPSADEEWLQPDLATWTAEPGTNAGSRAKARVGTQVIGTVNLPDTVDGPADRPAHAGEWNVQISEVTPRVFKVSYDATGSVSVTSGVGQWGALKWLPGSLLGGPGLIIRGFGRLSLIDGSVATADDGSDAQVFTWDAGPWAGTHADYMVSWVKSLMGPDRVTLSELQIVPDPRLQVGDRVTLDFTKTLGITVDAVIVGKKLSADIGSGLTMSITVMITAAAQTKAVRWGRFEAAWRAQAYSDVETAWAGSDYSILEASPLAHEPN